MDILEPLTSSDHEEDSKIILKESLGIEEHSLGSDDIDDAPHVEHLSPQTLLETPHEEVQYSFSTTEGTVRYGLLKVEDDNVAQLITPSFSNSGVSQLMTSNINGHVYVIGNASDVYVSQPGGPRAIAPRPNLSQGSSATSAQKGRVKGRDERRRATHNEVERRRRDKINNWIAKLAKIIPETQNTENIKNNGQYDGQSKGGILAKACEFISESKQKLEEADNENKRLSVILDTIKRKNIHLCSENKRLKEMLKNQGVEFIDES